MGQKLSIWQVVLSGVPQCSTLRPIFFFFFNIHHCDQFIIMRYTDIGNLVEGNTLHFS